MPNFEETIIKIEQKISVHQEDREKYTKDFDIIIKYLMDIMKKESPVFNQIYNGPSLFGSYLDNIKVVAPDEFDVHFLLKIPYNEYIGVEKDNHHPGCVKLSLAGPYQQLKTNFNNAFCKQFDKLVDPSKYLCRTKIQDWLGEILESALKIDGCFVPATASTTAYELKYIKKGTAHTIKAEAIGGRVSRKISIDLVPAFKFNVDSRNWFAERPFPHNEKYNFWFAVPKPCGPPEINRDLAWSICLPQVEKDLLDGKNNLKPSLRLFKSIRDKTIDGHLLKSYFIKTLYLYEVKKQHLMFWSQPQGKLLIEMIDRLLLWLDNKRLPCYWNPSKNLMENLRDDQILHLKNSFKRVRASLDRFSKQTYVDYEDLSSLFGNANRNRN